MDRIRQLQVAVLSAKGSGIESGAIHRAHIKPVAIQFSDS